MTLQGTNNRVCNCFPLSRDVAEMELACRSSRRCRHAACHHEASLAPMARLVVEYLGSWAVETGFDIVAAAAGGFGWEAVDTPVAAKSEEPRTARYEGSGMQRVPPGSLACWALQRRPAEGSKTASSGPNLGFVSENMPHRWQTFLGHIQKWLKQVLAANTGFEPSDTRTPFPEDLGSVVKALVDGRNEFPCSTPRRRR